MKKKPILFPVTGTQEQRDPRSGFTLLELSIVLTLIGVILGGGLVIFSAGVQTVEFNNTVQRMTTIDKTLINFAVANTRLPCPADLTKAVSAVNYGAEAANPGTCTGGTPAATFSSTSGTVEGGVPTRALALPDDYMYDGWGRKFRYAADPIYTVKGTLPASAQCTLSISPTVSAITVYDASGTAIPRSNNAVYALISHGANGHGGYTNGGGIMSASSTNASELANCHCSSTGAFASPYTSTYYERSPTLDSAATFDNFDDIVTFKDAWQIQQPNFPPTAVNCSSTLYVWDSANARMQLFTVLGGQVTYASQFTFSPAVNAFSVDASGNVWYPVSSYQEQQLSNAGTLLQTFGASGSTDGSFSAPYAPAFDSGGNLWVPDTGNYRVEKFTGPSPSGVATIIGAGYDGVTGIKGTSGLQNGQFGALADAVSFDGAGNFWVLDTGNNRVQKFSGSTGAYITQAIVISPTAIAVDHQNNLWAGSGSSVTKYDSTGTLKYTYNSSGTADGSFNTVNALAIDPSSTYLWVADAANNRVEYFLLGTPLTYVGAIGAGYNGVSGSKLASGSGSGQFNTPKYLGFYR